MSKKTAAIVLIVLVLVGSVVTFYGLNLLFSDVANMLMSKITVDVISSLPGFIFTLDFILASIYVIRYVRTPKYKKRMTLTYLIILGVFSLLGIASCILSGTLVYPSLLSPYPFKGYMVISLVAHTLILFFSIGGYYNAYKWMKDDEEKRKITFKYVLYTISLSLLTCFAFYRLGADLLGPAFIQWRTLYLTWPFYAAMLLPIAILTHTALYSFGVYRKSPKGGIIHASIVLGLSIALSLTIVLIGMNNTQFISAISPVLPLERLASLPIDTIVYIVLMIGFGTFEFVYSIRYYLKHKEVK